jgi:hypothetical protein
MCSPPLEECVGVNFMGVKVVKTQPMPTLPDVSLDHDAFDTVTAPLGLAMSTSK